MVRISKYKFLIVAILTTELCNRRHDSSCRFDAENKCRKMAPNTFPAFRSIRGALYVKHEIHQAWECCSGVGVVLARGKQDMSDKKTKTK